MITASVPPGGIQFKEKGGSPKVLKNSMQNYMQSKVGNVFLASEAAKRLGGDGVISMVGGPYPSLILYTDAIADLETEREPRPDEDRAAAP